MTLRKKSTLDYSVSMWICMFSIIYLGSSLFVSGGVIPGLISLGWWIICLGMVLYKNRRINRRIFWILTALLTVMFVSTIFNGDDVYIYFRIALTIVTAVLFICKYSFREIKACFVSVVCIIAIISLPLYLCAVFIPGVLSPFRGYALGGRAYYLLYIYAHDITSMRNGGLFWEPGVFSTFLNLALVTVMLDSDKIFQRKTLTYILLVLTNFLTFSTTGYIAMAVIFLIYLLNNETSKKEKAIVLILIGIIIAVVLRVYYDEIFGEGTKYTAGKIRALFDENTYSGSYLNSTNVRVFSIIYPFLYFIKNPILGVGYSNLQLLTLSFTKGAITCTFSNWFAIYGIFYGLIMVVGYINVARIGKKNINVSILLFVALLLIIISEDYSRNAFFVGLSILGYKEQFLKIKGED